MEDGCLSIFYTLRLLPGISDLAKAGAQMRGRGDGDDSGKTDVEKALGKDSMLHYALPAMKEILGTTTRELSRYHGHNGNGEFVKRAEKGYD